MIDALQRMLRSNHSGRALAWRRSAGGLAGSAKEFVDGVEETPCACRVDGDVAIEFSGCCEGGLFAWGDRIFEPVPVILCIVVGCGFAGCVCAEDESGFSIGAIAIPLGVAEGLIDAGAVEAADQGCDGDAGIGDCIGPGGEPAAVLHASEDGELGDDAGAKIVA